MSNKNHELQYKYPPDFESILFIIQNVTCIGWPLVFSKDPSKTIWARSANAANVGWELKITRMKCAAMIT